MRRYIENLGERFLNLIYYMGGTTLLFIRTLAWIPVPPIKRQYIMSQMKRIGVDSLPIVFLTSFFTGMVLALQSAYQMQKLQAEMYIASLVALSMTRELGPVLTALIVAGRVGASITAELGTMRVTEQIDALETLATNPVKYLVVPRFLALLLMLPILTLYADIIGIAGGYVVGVGRLGVSSSMYLKMTWDPLVYKDIFTGLAKAICFAIIICIVACYEGMNTKEGAEGVGKSTTLAVVTSFILIIAADCLITALFYFAFQVR
ncbi:MAG: ABC transporter permease [Candidatus Omnitrophica bacterium]|nr:ABC transporter permease [Candidatus Omnitrophota bacterium]